jgi:tetratricopeptide (TPR) repeat protein
MDKRIVDQLIYAINAEGQALLCEGKVLLNSELHEEAAKKLEEAHRRFTEAAERSGRFKHQHLMSRSYAEFLLGQTEVAEATFALALLSDPGETDWLDLKNWTELETFSSAKDDEFIRSLIDWSKRHRKNVT